MLHPLLFQVSLATIVSNYIDFDPQDVVAALDELEGDFEVYKKKGVYFPM